MRQDAPGSIVGIDATAKADIPEEFHSGEFGVERCDMSDICFGNSLGPVPSPKYRTMRVE